jgi:hypothetical protein
LLIAVLGVLVTAHLSFGLGNGSIFGLSAVIGGVVVTFRPPFGEGVVATFRPPVGLKTTATVFAGASRAPGGRTTAGGDGGII